MEDLEHYLNQSQTDMLQILLGKRKQLDDEETTSYINDAESLCKRVDPLIPQPEMIQKVLKGLKPTIARYIGILENNNITDLKSNIRKFGMLEFMITGEQTKALSEIKTSIFKDQLNNITTQLEENIKLTNDNNEKTQETLKKLNKDIQKNNMPLKPSNQENVNQLINENDNINKHNNSISNAIKYELIYNTINAINNNIKTGDKEINNIHNNNIPINKEIIHDNEGTLINISANLNLMEHKQVIGLIKEYLHLFTTDTSKVRPSNIEPCQIKMKPNYKDPKFNAPHRVSPQ